MENSSKACCTYAGCTKQYVHQKDLNKHVRAVHLNISKFGCPVERAGDSDPCPYRTSDLNAIRRHVNVHHKVKTYRCDFAGCGREWVDESQGRKHIRDAHPEHLTFSEIMDCPDPLSEIYSIDPSFVEERRQRAPRVYNANGAVSAAESRRRPSPRNRQPRQQQQQQQQQEQQQDPQLDLEIEDEILINKIIADLDRSDEEREQMPEGEQQQIREVQAHNDPEWSANVRSLPTGNMQDREPNQYSQYVDQTINWQHNDQNEFLPNDDENEDWQYGYQNASAESPQSQNGDIQFGDLSANSQYLDQHGNLQDIDMSPILEYLAQSDIAPFEDQNEISQHLDQNEFPTAQGEDVQFQDQNETWQHIDQNTDAQNEMLESLGQDELFSLMDPLSQQLEDSHTAAYRQAQADEYFESYSY